MLTGRISIDSDFCRVNIPINQQNSIDLGISYSSRGTTDYKLIKDQYVKFSIGINFGELWFVRRRKKTNNIIL